jgi:uncharacterized membrane protein YcaP (DUF421 family)
MAHDLLSVQIPLLEKALRSVAVYLFLLIVLRLAGKREMAQLNNFDLVVLLMLSNTVQNAIIGNDNSLAGGLFGAAILVGANRLVVHLTYDHPVLSRLVQGKPTTLVRNGRSVARNLHRELISREELLAALRHQGAKQLSDVELAVLEPSGALTIDQRDHLEEILDRLQRIERMLGGRPDAGEASLAP